MQVPLVDPHGMTPFQSLTAYLTSIHLLFGHIAGSSAEDGKITASYNNETSCPPATARTATPGVFQT